jgi:hypothetical protein
MSDINEFVKNMGNDINAAVAPRVAERVVQSGDQIAELAAPRVHDFVDGLIAAVAAAATPMARDFSHKLVKDIFDQQSVVVRDFVVKLVQDLAARYEPTLVGNVHTKVVNRGVVLSSDDTRLEIKERGTGKPVASLDLPVDLRINVNDFAVKLDSDIGLENVQL